jgi:hypothetical protein
MARRSPAAEPAAAPTVHILDPRGVYFVDTFQRLFRLRKSSVRREARAGRLRLAKRCGRYFILGAWILEWLEAGELPRRRPGPGKGGEADA